jgi:glycosyltransferase involved in cell wall biosynthesis
MTTHPVDRSSAAPLLLPSPERDHGVQQTGLVALIPAYNEARFIGSLVLSVRSHVATVVVIDDGSSDATAEIARRAGATVIQHQINQGKAAAVNTGFRYIRQLDPRAVVMLDGDGQHRADDVPAMLAPIISDSADLVVGSRFLQVKSSIPVYRQVGQHGLTMATNFASGVSLSDSQSGYRAFSRRALELLHFGQAGFSIESEMQFQAGEHKLRIVEVPISVCYKEPAKRNPMAHGLQVLNGILRMVGQVRPLLFFTLIALPFLLGGTLLGLHVIDIYIRIRQLAIGYALITVLLSEVGILLFFTGIILHSTRGMIMDLRHHLGERERWSAERAE